MRCLAVPGDAMPLDAEGSEDHAEREVERLEDRSLLDVKLEDTEEEHLDLAVQALDRLTTKALETLGR